jgi:hypothetical protein
MRGEIDESFGEVRKKSRGREDVRVNWLGLNMVEGVLNE